MSARPRRSITEAAPPTSFWSSTSDSASSRALNRWSTWASRPADGARWCAGALPGEDRRDRPSSHRPDRRRGNPADGLHGRESARAAQGGARRSADLVLSDMAANTVGHPQTDHLRTMALVEAALEFACEALRPGGAFVAKVLAGGGDNQLVTRLKQRFLAVKHAKPPASRKGSSEWYVVAQGFRSAQTARS
jgi:23S rRNA U2552 (ribose-2'-O)-methylase RlmE/FtsJ